MIFKKKPFIFAICLLAALAIYTAVSLWVSAEVLTVRRYQTDFGSGPSIRLAVLGDFTTTSLGRRIRSWPKRSGPRSRI